ncbi:MAG: ABC transporter ATP-binding protein [Elusimicrobia bacterium]|nr:ABC transporter ATP-binding protein [Elusimicrobiota bacterium]
MRPSPIITVKNLNKSYYNSGQELRVLKGLDLEFQPGEFIAIIGPSGAGKSTLLHILGLLDQPSNGELIFAGTNTKLLNDRERAGLRNEKIGFIFQFYHLLPEFTMLENVLMPQFISQNNFRLLATDRDKASAILGQVGLAERMGHFPNQLSGGEQQRVAIARSLFNDPGVILADEPTGNLDYKTSLEIINILHKINKINGKTLVMVTHNEEYSKKADRIIKLKDGRIVQ